MTCSNSPPLLDPSEALNLPTWRAAFSERTAELMAKMALLAYESDPADLKCRLSQGGFDLLATYNVGVTQGFLARSQHFAVLAFRGTDSFVDWRANLNARSLPLETSQGTVRVHQGFRLAFETLSDQIRTDLDRLVPASTGLYLTGHSLGGALAQIASAQFERENLAACYTYGAPRVGDTAFDRFVKCPHYRFIHGWDLVTTLPPPLFTPFRHTGDARLLSSKGQAMKRGDRNPGLKIIQTTLGLVYLLFGNLRLFDDHRMEAYLAKIKAARAQFGSAQSGLN
jgi:triacylglycerol lipase